MDGRKKKEMEATIDGWRSPKMESCQCHVDVRIKSSTGSKDGNPEKVFSKHGEVVYVYMALKIDVNWKTFAFVRFKRVDDETELERAYKE